MHVCIVDTGDTNMYDFIFNFPALDDTFRVCIRICCACLIAIETQALPYLSKRQPWEVPFRASHEDATFSRLAELITYYNR